MNNIIGRDEWKAKSPKTPFIKHFPRKITIHHQGGTDSYPDIHQMSSFEGAKTMRAIQNFHRDGRGWCFSLDTEILTKKGWKNFKTISKDDEVFTVEDGFTKHFQILNFKNSETIGIKTLNYSGVFTPNHKLFICKQHSKKYQKTMLSDVIDDISTPYRVLTSVIQDSETKYDLNYCKLISMTVADGSFMKGKDYNVIEYSFKKERKINYLIDILNSLNAEYRIHTHKLHNGYVVIHLTDKDIISKLKSDVFACNKKQLNWNLINLSYECKLAIIDGYLNSDGAKTKYTYYNLFSTVKQNIDILQAICHLSGMRTKLTEPPLTGFQKHTLYTLCVNPETNNVIVDLRDKKLERTIQDTWSVDCGGKLLMVRHGGCVQVTSNSDIGYHAVIAPDGEIYQGRPFDVVGAHTKNNNTGNIGIMIVGNFEVEKPSKEQIQSLKELIIFLKTIFPQLDIPKCIHGHKEFMMTDCPGKNLFPIIMDLKYGKMPLFDEPK